MGGRSFDITCGALGDTLLPCNALDFIEQHCTVFVHFTVRTSTKQCLLQNTEELEAVLQQNKTKKEYVLSFQAFIQLNDIENLT